MKCLKCNKPMNKVSWHITSNGKDGKDYKEYDYTTYVCQVDDIWVNTEVSTLEDKT